MKKLIWLVLVLTTAGFACQTLVPTSVIPTSITPLQEAPVLTATAVLPSPLQTEIPSATSNRFPTPLPITCTDDSCLDACLQRIEKVVPQTEYEPLTGAYAENNIDLNLVYYDVKDGQLGEPHFLEVPDAFKAYQQDTTAQQALWNYASSLLTPDIAKWFNQFEIFRSTIYSGWVKPPGWDLHNRSHWILGMELAYAQNPVDVTYTLVHEYGHLIMMNTDQIPASDFYYNWYQNTAICKQFLSPSGCSTPDSYINHFYQAFWKDILDEWLMDGGSSVVPNTEEARRLEEYFYKKHSDLFLTEHAAANIDEDMATSFEFFVLTPKPAGNSILEQKILFFYDYPELVALRQHMIQAICSYTGQ